jgi:metal-sulfur cluster biosynthetic enzyme
MVTTDKVLETCKPICDPEIPISIVDLGLIYGSEYDEAAKKLTVKLTFTTANCPAGPSLIAQVKGRCEDLDGVDEAVVDVVFSPAWKPEMATLDGKIQLNALGFSIPIE